MKYNVQIIEKLIKTVSVEAESACEAEQIVTDRYHNSEYILTSDDFSDAEIKIESPTCPRTIELPVSVGDHVYAVCETFWKIFDYQIESVTMSNDAVQFEAYAKEGDELTDCIDFTEDDIGKTVFLNKQDCINAL